MTISFDLSFNLARLVFGLGGSWSMFGIRIDWSLAGGCRIAWSRLFVGPAHGMVLVIYDFDNQNYFSM